MPLTIEEWLIYTHCFIYFLSTPPLNISFSKFVIFLWKKLHGEWIQNEQEIPNWPKSLALCFRLSFCSLSSQIFFSLGLSWSIPFLLFHNALFCPSFILFLSLLKKEEKGQIGIEMGKQFWNKNLVFFSSYFSYSVSSTITEKYVAVETRGASFIVFFYFTFFTPKKVKSPSYFSTTNFCEIHSERKVKALFNLLLIRAQDTCSRKTYILDGIKNEWISTVAWHKPWWWKEPEPHTHTHTYVRLVSSGWFTQSCTQSEYHNFFHSKK